MTAGRCSWYITLALTKEHTQASTHVACAFSLHVMCSGQLRRTSQNHAVACLISRRDTVATQEAGQFFWHQYSIILSFRQHWLCLVTCCVLPHTDCILCTECHCTYFIILSDTARLLKWLVITGPAFGAPMLLSNGAKCVELYLHALYVIIAWCLSTGTTFLRFSVQNFEARSKQYVHTTYFNIQKLRNLPREWMGFVWFSK